jgi:hypothetical protein
VFLLWKVLQQGWNDDNGMEGKFYVVLLRRSYKIETKIVLKC